MFIPDSSTKTLRIEWSRGNKNVETKDIIISSAKNPQNMSEVIFREVFQVKTYMNFYEETNTYESKPSTLNIYEIENGKRKNFVGKANLDFSDYISKIDH